MEKTAIILVNYKDYAKRFLNDCLKSIRRQNWKSEIKIFIVDNKTSEESFNYLKCMAPEAEIIRNKNNDGFAKGNNDAMKVAIKQGYNYIALFNLDIVVDENCVAEMIKVANSNDKIGAVQARLMLYPEREKINSLGNKIHFLGFGYCDCYRDSITNYKLQINNYKDICYPSGAGVLFKRNVLEKVGLFDEKFWMYNEDEDLGWRFWLSGYKNVLAANAIIYHKYEFGRSIKKYYWMERNRIITILKNYKLASLILIFPAFIAMELGMWIFVFKNGWWKEKIKVYFWFLKIKNWKYILKQRKKSQVLRKVKDRKIIKMFTGKIWYQEINDWKLRFANKIFNIYFTIIKYIIFW